MRNAVSRVRCSRWARSRSSTRARTTARRATRRSRPYPRPGTSPRWGARATDGGRGRGRLLLEGALARSSLGRPPSAMLPPVRSASLALLCALGAAACGGGSGGGGGPDPAVAALRDELPLAGITPLPDPPLVSDELFELGRLLFFDKILAGSQDVACSTCHSPSFASGDARTLSNG